MLLCESAAPISPRIFVVSLRDFASVVQARLAQASFPSIGIVRYPSVTPMKIR